MTGVEAVSNGVMAFRDDTRKNAKITLTIIIVLLAVLLAGIAVLAAVCVQYRGNRSGRLAI